MQGLLSPLLSAAFFSSGSASAAAPTRVMGPVAGVEGTVSPQAEPKIQSTKWRYSLDKVRP
jgi:hypothetical protein